MSLHRAIWNGMTVRRGYRNDLFYILFRLPVIIGGCIYWQMREDRECGKSGEIRKSCLCLSSVCKYRGPTFSSSCEDRLFYILELPDFICNPTTAIEWRRCRCKCSKRRWLHSMGHRTSRVVEWVPLEDAVDRLQRDVVVWIIFDNFTVLNCFFES